MPRSSVVQLRKALPRNHTRHGSGPARAAGSLTAAVTERIRVAIVEGHFALGEALRQIRAAADAMERARDAGDRRGLARADTAFHQAIVENSAGEYLVAAYHLVSGRVAALRADARPPS